MRIQVQYLALLSGLRIWHCCKLQYRLQMQLGSHVAVAVVQPVAAATIQPLAWELPYATGVALKGKEEKRNSFNKKFKKAR